VETLACVRSKKIVGPGIVILMCPALRARKSLSYWGAQLATIILLPRPLIRMLIAVEELAGLVNLINMTIGTLSTRVKVLLRLGIVEHD
jgi:hypothetical protein